MKPSIRRQFLKLTGLTSAGIAIPFEEIPAETWDLDQTMLYVTRKSEIILRCHIRAQEPRKSNIWSSTTHTGVIAKQQFKIPNDIISDTDQNTWSMAQTIKVLPSNDCILEKIEIQTPALLLARQFLNGSKVSDWYPLGIPPVQMLSQIEQNFSFPNGLISH